EVAGEEEELADDEEVPRCPSSRPVEVDPDCDRDRGGEAQEIDERAVSLERRKPQVCACEDRTDRQVGDPDASAHVHRAETAHAAYSLGRAGRRSKALA